MTGSVLSVRGLNKRYGKRTVVKDDVAGHRQRRWWGLLGPNGAGKTTSLARLSAWSAPMAGEMRLMSTTSAICPSTSAPNSGWSYLPQEASIFAK